MRRLESQASNIITFRRAMKPRIQIASPDGELLLTQYIPADAQAAFDLINRNRLHLSQYGESTGTLFESAEDFKKRIITAPIFAAAISMGIWNRDSQLVGDISVIPYDLSPRAGIISYYKGSEYEGDGSMRNALDTFTSYLFSNERYTSLEAYVHPNNNRSAKVLNAVNYHNVGIDEDGSVQFRREARS